MTPEKPDKRETGTQTRKQGGFDESNTVPVNPRFFLKRYCAWHPRYFGIPLLMGETPATYNGETHGICNQCQPVFNAEILMSQEGEKPYDQDKYKEILLGGEIC